MAVTLGKEEKRLLEIDNGLRQFDYALEAINYFIDPERPFALRPTLIRELQSIAVLGIEERPGEWRSGPIQITKSEHVPPGHHLVNILVTELCDYINNHWHEASPFNLSSYAMWRLNWIHPFDDGNGRTSRVLAYVILSIKLGYVLPGSPTIPQQIESDRAHYFEGLEAADAAFKADETIDLSVLETALKGMLAAQLLSVIEAADGNGA